MGLQDGGVSGATDETEYLYNAVDKLRRVTMARGSTTEIQEFVFGAEMRLSRVTQPDPRL